MTARVGAQRCPEPGAARRPAAAVPDRRGPGTARRLPAAGLLAVLAVAGCGRPAADELLPAVREGRPVRLVVLGDSLAAGHGVGPRAAFPALLAAELEQRGVAVELANEAESGASAAHGHRQLARVPFPRIDLALLELGTNDALRGRPADAVRDELLALVDALQARGARVVLLGVDVPALALPLARRAGYAELWTQVAEARDVPLLPSLLEDVAGRPERMLPDRVHPNVAGQRVLARRTLAFLDALGWLGIPAEG